MNKKAFKNSSSSRRSLSPKVVIGDLVRDIKSFLLRPYPALQACGVTRPEGVRGFTLIELLVVVLIIGILAAIALPQYEKAVEKSRIAEAKIILKSIVNAESRYGLDTGNDTSNFENLDIIVPGECTTTDDTTVCVTKNFTYYYDENICMEGASNVGNCVVVCAGRNGKDYNVCAAGSEYDDELMRAGHFYCQVLVVGGDEAKICKAAGAIPLANGNYYFE